MEKPKFAFMDKFLLALHWAVIVIEMLVAVALTALAAGALLSLGIEMWGVAMSHAALPRAQFSNVMGEVLQVFILVELFRIAIAYMRHENVVPTVLEAALVAVARNFVVFESPDSQYLVKAIGLSALLLAVAVSWWLLSKSNACDMDIET
jgi:uncharacterized membrane protein (DUF373 family)